jgi:hypothetical protein
MKKITFIVLVLALLIAALPAMASRGGGNLDCADVGTYEFSSGRINFENGEFDGDFPAEFTVTTDGTYVTWTTSIRVDAAVIVKGGPAANVFYFEGFKGTVSYLVSPDNSSDGPAGLSNITFCWTPVPDPAPESWCSPGYWRQAHHIGSWAATGYAPTDSYNDIFGTSLKGNPSLWDVLQAPKTYGGPTFNTVGDLLSGAHPEVNFLGNRVENSCPLGRAE